MGEKAANSSKKMLHVHVHVDSNRGSASERKPMGKMTIGRQSTEQGDWWKGSCFEADEHKPAADCIARDEGRDKDGDNEQGGGAR